VAEAKIKKDIPTLTLELIRTPDILTEVKGNFLKVGFAAESENVVENAKQKLQKKQLAIIVANDITKADSGFAVDTNKVTIIDRDGKVENLPLLAKREVADRILDRVEGLLRPLEPEIKIKFVPSALDYGLIPLPRKYRHLFPGFKVPFTLIIEGEEITTKVTSSKGTPPIGDPKAGNRIQGGLTHWYQKHPELKIGDHLVFAIKIIEPKKKYHLEIWEEAV